MSVQLVMTDEQAKWLLELLQRRVSDLSWADSRVALQSDDALHSQAVAQAIEKIIKARTW